MPLIKKPYASFSLSFAYKRYLSNIYAKIKWNQRQSEYSVRKYNTKIKIKKKKVQYWITFSLPYISEKTIAYMGPFLKKAISL